MMVKVVKLVFKIFGGKDIWIRIVEGICSVFDDCDVLFEGYDVFMV